MSISVLSKEFEKLKSDLIVAYDAKGMRASGKFADSLEVMIFNDESSYKAQLWGEDYAQQLETGRQGGTYPPIDAIKKWIVDKGIFTQALQNIKLSSLAFLIARKIYRNGWKRQGHGGVDLISQVITPERLQDIIDEVGAVEAMRISSEIEFLINDLMIV